MNYLMYYLDNDGRNLKKISDNLITNHFGWLSQMHYDDFYSIANEVLWRCVEQFDNTKGAQFETYLIGCLTRKFKTRITYMNRKRRNNGGINVSLDALIDDGDTCLMNMIASNDMAEPFTYSDKMNSYLDRLSALQKKVLFALADDHSSEEIKKALNITTTEFSDACTAIKAYRNVSLLY